MTRDEIVNAFLIPLAWEPVNGDQKAAWPYAVMQPFLGPTWLAYRFDVPLADPVNGGVAFFPTEADAIAACEADHRAEAVKTWDLAKIEALVGAAMNVRDLTCEAIEDDDGNSGCGQCVSDCTGCVIHAALATIRGRS